MELELLTKILAGGGGVTAAIYLLYYGIVNIEKKLKEVYVELKKDSKEIASELRQEFRDVIERVESMHVEGMVKLDKAIDTVNNLTTTLAVHSKELEHGDKRFIKVEEELTLLRKTNHDFRNSLHEIKNKMVTQEHLRVIIKDTNGGI